MKIKTPTRIKIHQCPYRASNNGSCAHKGMSSNRRGKRYCGYGDPNDCPLFKEWLAIKESVSRMAKKGYKAHTRDDI